MKRCISVLLIVLFLFMLFGCGQKSSTDAKVAPKDTGKTGVTETASGSEAAKDGVSKIKVGILLPFSGSAAYQGELLKEGYQYAAEYYNSNGGIKSLGGAKYELLFADHTGVAEVGVTEFERLINAEKVDICSGTNSSAVLGAIGPLTEKYKMPFVVSQGSALSIYKSGYTYIFNPGNDARTNAQGLVGICEMIEKKFNDKIDGIGFLVENTEWGISQKESFEKYFAAAGKAVMFSETFESGTADFSSQISKLKASGVKFVMPVISSFSDAVLFVRQMKEYKCNAGILACGGVFVVPEFAKAMGDDANYIFSTDTWNKDFLPARGEKAVAIHKGYIDKYGHNMGENAGMAWIAMSVMTAALEKAGSLEPDAIRDALFNLKLDESSEYMLMIPFEGVQMDTPTEDGCKGRNIFGISTCSQLINGEWRMVWPDRLLGENNPVVWPIPN